MVAAVTNAGGFGVLGAASHTPEQLEHELAWIDDHVHGRPYGADIVAPDKFVGKGGNLNSKDLSEMIPASRRSFVAELPVRHDMRCTPKVSESPIVSEKLLAATSRDTIRSAGRTGKPSRR